MHFKESVRLYEHIFSVHVVAHQEAALAGLLHTLKRIVSDWIEEQNRAGREALVLCSSGGGGVSGGQTDPLFQAFKHLSIIQRPDVRKRMEEIGESDRPQTCSKCGEPRRGHVCQAVGSNEQVGAVAERTRRSLLAKDMLSSTPVEVLARLDLDFQAFSTSSTHPSNLLEAALDPDPPVPASKSSKSALQLQLEESRKANKETELKMEEMARELAGYRALNAGQLGAHKNRPLPQHAQVPTAGWRPPGAAIAPPLASAAAPRGPSAAGPSTSFPPAAAKSKKSDPLAKLKKK